jgi:hypothetical protein
LGGSGGGMGTGFLDFDEEIGWEMVDEGALA